LAQRERSGTAGLPLTITGMGNDAFARPEFTTTAPAYTGAVKLEFGVIVRVVPERFTLTKLGTDASANPVTGERSLASRVTVWDAGVAAPF